MTTNTDKKEDNQLITIEGLIGVGNVELNLMPNQKVYTFIGSNGVGKTKVLEALFQKDLLLNKLFIDVDINGFKAIPFKEIAVSKKTIYGNSYSFNFNGDCIVRTSKPYHQPISYPLQEYACVFLGANSRSNINNNKIASLPPLGSFSERRKKYFAYILDKMNTDFKSLGMSEDVKLWFVSRYVSAVFLKSDNRRFEIDNVLIALNKIDKRFDPEFIEVDGQYNVSLKVDNKQLQLNELSSGFTSALRIIQSIISGYANFTNETNLTDVKGIVFIDEIESHLHLKWQVEIIPLLKKIFPKTTFYIATHSPLILTQLQQGEAYRLVRGTDKVVRSELIEQPSKKLFDDVLDDAFDINLNQLKRDQMLKGSQTEAKKKLLDLINNVEDVV